MAEPIVVACIVFLGVFTQSLTGFGVALVSMALLPTLIGITVAAPLVAVVALILELVLLLRYRKAFNFRTIWPLILAALVGIPLGVWLLGRLDRDVFLSVLGVILSGYALYALSGVRLPNLDHPAWAYGTGFVAGILGGAYNTSGPPLVIYGNCKGWLPAEFKTNLQGFFLFSDIFIVANHIWQRNLTAQVWEYLLWCLPAILIGVLLGTSLDRYISPVFFRKMVLGLLFILGLRLIFF